MSNGVPATEHVVGGAVEARVVYEFLSARGAGDVVEFVEEGEGQDGPTPWSSSRRSDVSAGTASGVTHRRWTPCRRWTRC